MKTMKSLLVAAITVALAFTFPACDDDDSSSNIISKASAKSNGDAMSKASAKNNENVIIIGEDFILENPQRYSNVCEDISNAVRKQNCIDSLKQNGKAIVNTE